MEEHAGNKRIEMRVRSRDRPRQDMVESAAEEMLS
jgi:hypothetical protein